MGVKLENDYTYGEKMGGRPKGSAGQVWKKKGSWTMNKLNALGKNVEKKKKKGKGEVNRKAGEGGRKDVLNA